MSVKTIFVTGATGKQGSTAVRHLIEAGFKVKGMTRDLDRPITKELEELGAEMVKGNLDDPASVRRDIDGSYGVFAVLTWTEEGPAGEIRQGKTLADAAKDAGVEHFVYSSVGGAERNTGVPHFDSKWKIEQYLNSIQIPLTVLRPTYFMENFNNPPVCRSIRDGTLPFALDPDKRMQFIATEDIGFFAAIALDNKEDWLGRAVELAGDSLTMPMAADAFSRYIGRKVTYRETSLQELKKVNHERFLQLRWFNEAGYKADIPALRQVHPTMMTLDTWLEKGFWAGMAEKKEVIAQRA